MKIKNLSLILLASLLLGACGNKDAKPAERPKQEESQVEETKQEESKDENTNTGVKEVADYDKESSNTEKEKAPEVAMNMEDAVKIFHEHNFGEASAESINIDKLKVKFLEQGLEYEIFGFKAGKEYQIKIDDNGNILEEEIEEYDDNNKLALDFDKLFPPTQAMEKALEDQGENSKIEEYEIKIEDGKAIFDIEIENGKDLKMDATTGEIIERY